MVKTRRSRRTEGAAVADEVKQDKGTIKVYRTYTANGVILSEDEGIEDMEVRKFNVEPAYVSYSCGRTANLGNYESARIDVRVSIPTYVEEVEEALLYTEQTANNFMEDSMKEYIKEIK